MITVAVVAILAAIAIPSYQSHIRKSRRAEAQAHLMAVASRQHQFLVDTRAYATTLAAVGLSAPPNVAAHYLLELELPGGTPPTFTLRATPQGAQVNEPCGTLSINDAGAKTAAVSGCW